MLVCYVRVAAGDCWENEWLLGAEWCWISVMILCSCCLNVIWLLECYFNIVCHCCGRRKWSNMACILACIWPGSPSIIDMILVLIFIVVLILNLCMVGLGLYEISLPCRPICCCPRYEVWRYSRSICGIHIGLWPLAPIGCLDLIGWWLIFLPECGIDCELGVCENAIKIWLISLVCNMRS